MWVVKVKSAVKGYFTLTKVNTYSTLFRVHSVFTVGVLLFLSLLFALEELTSVPIKCFVNTVKEENDFVSRYCWMMTTYLLPDATFGRVDVDIVAPGMGHNRDGNNGRRKYYKYYQWVPIVLFLQAYVCQLPKRIWTRFENNLMQNLVMDHPGIKSLVCHKCNDEAKKKRKETLIKYLVTSLKKHQLYTFCYFVCEFLCFVNTALQVYFMNIFLGGEFFQYGWDVLWARYSRDPQFRDDTMASVFPYITKCEFKRYGPSGTIVTLDAMCLLPWNLLHEKAYIFLWVWFLLLSVATGALVAYRFALFFVPKLRKPVIKCEDAVLNKTMTEDLRFSDWWLLYMLKKNLCTQYFNEVINEVALRKCSKDFSATRIDK